jgi:16S rRNA (uracil1498-N3)-methyltransferase
MQLFYIKDPDQGILSENESLHCIRSLRKKRGDIIHATDGAGMIATLRIENPDPRKCAFSVVSTVQIPYPPYFIHIAIAPTKQMERIEWFAEKATEMGIHEISLYTARHSERTAINLQRIQRKIVSAAKQSGRSHFPKINDIANFEEILTGCSTAEKYIAHFDEKNPRSLHSLASKDSRYTVLIGPEGDFSSDEVDMAVLHDFSIVSLSPHRLRTETAGLAACQILASINY